jgi:hypothetical protein
MTQGMTKAKVVQFWYGILNKELRHQVQDAIMFRSHNPLGKCVIIIGTNQYEHGGRTHDYI